MTCIRVSIGMLLAGCVLVLPPLRAAARQPGDAPRAAVDNGGIAQPTAAADRLDLTAAQAPQDLYLEIVDGQRTRERLVHVRLQDGSLSIAAGDLRSLGIVLPPGLAGRPDGDWIALRELPGLSYRYERATQRLALQVPTALRPMQRLGYQPPPAVDVQRDWGALVSYDVYGRQLGDVGTLSLGHTLRWFGPFGAIEAAGVGRTGEHAPTTYRRLETRWLYSDPARLWTWAAGDVISGGLTWTRPVRLGGLQWRRSFEVRPDLVQLPVPRFAGDATVPASVELYIDNIRQYQADIQDGPFVIDAIPRISGAGQATLVVTDTLGRVTQTSLPLYVDHQRLARGLTDFSLEAGMPRTGFAGADDSYARDPIASGSIRHGVTNTLTLEGHGEASRRAQLAGAGAIWAPANRWGVLAGSYARSSGGGAQHAFGYQWTMRGFGFDAQRTRRNDRFRDLGDPAAIGVDTPLASPRLFDRATAWLPAGPGNVSLTWLRWQDAGGTRQWTRALSWTQTLGRRLSFSASLFDDRAGGRGGGLTLTVPFGRRSYAGLTVQRDRTGYFTSASIRQTAPYEGGWGWSAQASDRPGGYAQATGEVRGRLGEARFGVDRSGGDTGGFFQASGSVASMGGRVFASRRIQDAFAVVSTGGRAGVPVLNENRPFGRTNGGGYLLVPDLRGWQRNRLSIDPDGLTASYRVGALQQTATPADRSGILVRFDVTEIHPARLLLLGPDGAPIPAGSAGQVVGTGEPVLAGYDGEAYVEQLPDEAIIEMNSQGIRCRYRIPAAAPAAAGALTRRGPFACEVIPR